MVISPAGHLNYEFIVTVVEVRQLNQTAVDISDK